MDPLGASDALGLDPQSTNGNGNLDDVLRNTRLSSSNHEDIRDTNIMFHAPLSDIDNDVLGLYNIDSNTLHHSEIMSHHNEMVSNESELSMISETNDISLEPEDNSHAFERDELIFEENNDLSPESFDGNATCEYCGVVGVQDSFYSKSKRFCKMECSKKYSALFQKKGPGTRQLNLPQKRGKKERPQSKLKKIKLEQASDPGMLSTLESSLEQVTINEFKSQANFSTRNEENNEDGGNWIDQEFNWKDYLEQTGDKPASERLFKHVVKAPRLSEVHHGLKVEVINDHSEQNNDSDVCFWVATVINTDCNMMLLRYCGCPDDTSDFWFDVRSKHLHPVGWCYRARYRLVPPAEIRNIISDWQKYIFQELSGCRTLSAEFMEQVQKGHYNKFEIGSKVEVCDKRNLLSMCVATIIDIVGDRLRLRYDGLDDEFPSDSWAHFLSSDIHPVGWSQLVGHTLSPPIGWKHSLTEWNEFLAEDLHDSKDAPQDCFVPESMGTPPSSNGSFEIGMKLEALDPFNPLCLTVASVVKILHFNYFVVGLDGQEVFFICHSSSNSIFPVGWSKQHKVFLTPPKDMIGKPFDWDKYLLKCDSIAAPAHLFLHLKKRIYPFEIGTKVEAVDLREPSFICPATIVAIHGSLLRVHFDGWDSTFDQWVSHESYDLFPVNWCERNGKSLQPPGSLSPDPVLEAIRGKKSQRRTTTPGRIGRPPGSLNKSHTTRTSTGRNSSGKGAKGGKAEAKQGKLKRTPSGSNIPFEKQRFGNLREMRKGGEVQFAFNQYCACGPFLNPDEIRKLPDSISGYLNGPPHQNCIRKSLHEIVNAAVDPNQLLELFSREFYQSKRHKDLKLDNSICLEITGKNGKRFLRRVRGPSRSSILSKYLRRICEMLQCCPNMIVEERFPSGKCLTGCHNIYRDGSSSVLHIDGMSQHNVKIIDDDNMDDYDEKDYAKMEEYSPQSDKLVTSNSFVTSSQRHLSLDSPCNPSSSSADRGIDPLNLLDQEFLSSKDPREWSVQEVMDFMTAIGCPAHAPSFQKQEIDGKALFLLSFDELESLTENKLGPITKLKDAIKSLKKMWQITTLPNHVTTT
ncbi:scm-like with four MBT domains protein 2 isoform X1 [Hydra vulgaris]|uniref:scm-like with four MBT domains protein 2 isoform X1 n=1 Tax=Hydra vulgaris TaxID=6087 RepID=UPI001F5E61F1|nr:scm-like with four MBT domains protein 2 [Hydra vulgaris]